LTFPQGAFETGSHDVFSLTTPDINPLRELTLGHDGKGLGAAWYVDTAEMEVVATGGRTCLTPCCVASCSIDVKGVLAVKAV
jgi:hypothetical protein